MGTSIIPALEIEKKSFSEGFEIIQNEWNKQHPERSFPVSLTEFGTQNGVEPSPAIVTLRLKNVPFVEALLYLSESSRMGISEHSGLMNLSQASSIVEDWSTQRYPLSPKILGELGLDGTASPAEVRDAYARYEIRPEDWMKMQIVDDQLLMMGYDGHHAYVRALHHFLDSGFTLTKNSETSATDSSNSH